MKLIFNWSTSAAKLLSAPSKNHFFAFQRVSELSSSSSQSGCVILPGDRSGATSGGTFCSGVSRLEQRDSSGHGRLGDSGLSPRALAYNRAARFARMPSAGGFFGHSC